MAELAGNLADYNLARVIIVDVSDDYRLMQPPLPSSLYPVLKEMWMPRYSLDRQLAVADLVTGYLYDWHEMPETGPEAWYVGVVQEELTFREP
jgi:hypothetical protein